MEKLIINGNNILKGEIEVQGAKNSVLPILSACVLCKGQIVLHNVPKLTDVDAAVRILSKLDCKCKLEGNTLIIDSGDTCPCIIESELMREMRSSIIFMGAILGRCKEAVMSFPGGCELGARPIDLHISSLEKMGVKFNENYDRLYCNASNGIKGAYINLSFPSVGATENIMLAATLASGTTVIENAAREPEIIDLAKFLNKCGAKISGAGESVIKIEGVKEIIGCEFNVMGDRIVASTYLSAAVMTHGEIYLKNCPVNGVKTMSTILEDSGCKTIWDNDNLYINCKEAISAFPMIRTMPYPGFPTDSQAIFMAMATTANGTSVFVENIFDSRYKHASELVRMGAKIKIEGKVAVIEGVKKLHASYLEAKELRGGAALVMAALSAEGESTVTGLQFIDRGYENLERNLSLLGADIKRII